MRSSLSFLQVVLSLRSLSAPRLVRLHASQFRRARKFPYTSTCLEEPWGVLGQPAEEEQKHARVCTVPSGIGLGGHSRRSASAPPWSEPKSMHCRLSIKLLSGKPGPTRTQRMPLASWLVLEIGSRQRGRSRWSQVLCLLGGTIGDFVSLSEQRWVQAARNESSFKLRNKSDYVESMWPVSRGGIDICLIPPLRTDCLGEAKFRHRARSDSVSLMRPALSTLDEEVWVQKHAEHRT